MLSDWTSDAPDWTKEQEHEHLPALRVQLIDTQLALKESGRNLIVVLAGDDRPGINAILDDLHEWLDARGLSVHTLDEDRSLKRHHPPFWRYWRIMPPFGHIAVFYHNWVQDAFEARMQGKTSKPEFKDALTHCRRLERHLVQDHSVLVKCYLHLSDEDQEERLKAAEKDPEKYYRIHESDRRRYEFYKDGREIIDEALRRTDAEHAPWQIIDSGRTRHAPIQVAEAILAGMQQALAKEQPATFPLEDKSSIDRLRSIDLGTKISSKDYRNRLRKAQLDINTLTFRAEQEGLSSILVFEGVDAAGKGGAIRRLTRAISAEHYEIVPIAAPTPDELNHHYLWRFWNRLPARGDMIIFDRSWYGRVLVERVEGFCSTYDWQRAYDEIKEFEEQLVDNGILLLKFWLHIDQDEQLERFQKRLETPEKRYKITDEDYRNREKWPAYEQAINDMLAHTDTAVAPWHLVPANSKHWARVQILETVRDALRKAL